MAAAAAAIAPQKNYKCVKSLERFYSGGPYSVSPDGSFIVCACDETIKLINSSDASVISTIKSDSTSVTALCISPNANFLFSSSDSGQIRVWDLSTLQCLRSWEGHEGPVSGMACDASGGILATTGNDGKMTVWDANAGISMHHFEGHSMVVLTVVFRSYSTNSLLFSGSQDATARIWDLTTKKCIASLRKHQAAVTSIGFSEDGGTLLTAGRDGLVYFWDLHDYSFKSSVVVNEAVEAICVIYSSSPFASCLGSSVQVPVKQKGIHFITVGERGIVRIWDSNRAVCHFEQKSSDFAVVSEANRRGFTSAVVLPSGQGLLTVTADQEFLFYSPTKTPDGLNLNLDKRLVGYNEEIVDMKFLGEEEQFLAVATSVEQVRVYDLDSMSCSYVLAGHNDIVLSLDTCVSTSGRALIVTGSKDNTVRLWETDSGCCIGVGVGHVGAVGAVAFSKKSRNFFVSGSTDCTLKVWSFDGLLNDGDSSLKVKAAAGSHDKGINSIAIEPNDSLVCSGSQDRTACIRRLPDLVSVTVLRGHEKGIWSVEFSPVDKCVLTASEDKTVKMWAISDGSCLKTFEGHTSCVLRALFVPSGSQFVSCGSDGLLKLWAVETNQCIATHYQHKEKICALAVGKKTEMLATGSADAVVRLWHESTTSYKDMESRKEARPYCVSAGGIFIACACDETIKILRVKKAIVETNIKTDSTCATALCFGARATHLFSSHSGQIRVWDRSSGRCLRSWKGHVGPISAMVCDTSGGLLATAGKDCKVKVWTTVGICTNTYEGHSMVVSAVLFHSDPSKSLLFSASEDTTVRIWNLNTNENIALLQQHQLPVTSLGLSEDGWTLLSAGKDKIVYLWDLNDFHCKSSVAVNEALEAICVIGSSSPFALCLASSVQMLEKQIKGNGIQFVTVGEHGVVRIWDSDGAICHFEQKYPDFAVGSEDNRRGFTSAVLLPPYQPVPIIPAVQELIGVTADEELIFYSLKETPYGLNLQLNKRVMAYKEDYFYFSWRTRPYFGYSIISEVRNQSLTSENTCPHHSAAAVLEMQQWMKLIREGRTENRKKIHVYRLYKEYDSFRIANGIHRENYGTSQLLTWLMANAARAEDGSEVCTLARFDTLNPLEKKSDFSKMLEHLIKNGPFIGAFYIKQDFRGDGQEIYMCNTGIVTRDDGIPKRHAVAVVGFGVDRNDNLFWEYLESVSPGVSTFTGDGFNRIFFTGFDRAYMLHV